MVQIMHFLHICSYLEFPHTRGWIDLTKSGNNLKKRFDGQANTRTRTTLQLRIATRPIRNTFQKKADRFIRLRNPEINHFLPETGAFQRRPCKGEDFLKIP